MSRFPVRTPLIGFLALTLFSLGAAVVTTAATDEVVARIGDAPVTAAEVRSLEALAGPEFLRIPEAFRLKEMAGRYIDIQLLASRAIEAGLDSKEAVQQALTKAEKAPVPSLARSYVLARAFIQARGASISPTEGELLAAYKEASAKREYQASHILVTTEGEAREIERRLALGEAFDTLARSLSIDTMSGQQGGDLGWFPLERMVPEFASAVANLDLGTISDPVQSPYGWHVIKLRAVRPIVLPPFDKVRDSIVQFVVNQKIGEEIKAIRRDARIQWNDGVPPRSW